MRLMSTSTIQLNIIKHFKHTLSLTQTHTLSLSLQLSVSNLQFLLSLRGRGCRRGLGFLGRVVRRRRRRNESWTRARAASGSGRDLGRTLRSGRSPRFVRAGSGTGSRSEKKKKSFFWWIFEFRVLGGWQLCKRVNGSPILRFWKSNQTLRGSFEERGFWGFWWIFSFLDFWVVKYV